MFPSHSPTYGNPRSFLIMLHKYGSGVVTYLTSANREGQVPIEEGIQKMTEWYVSKFGK